MATIMAMGAATSASAQLGYPEDIEIGLSTDTILVTSDFSGTRLTVFGALSDLDMRALRQNQYELVVVLEGPRAAITVRKRERVLGVWMNMDSHTLAAPLSYSIASTAPLRDIAPARIFERLQVGIDRLGAALPGQDMDPDFARALRRLRSEKGFYAHETGSVRFLSNNLFRATLSLPASVPVGQHNARAFLFRAGIPVAVASEPLRIVKSDIEQRIFQFSRSEPLLYGLVAVLAAILIGWLGRLIFRRE